MYRINGVKTDFILHQYPCLQPVETVDDVRLSAIDDIIPMKINAVCGRGAKKDFWDIAELLDHYGIDTMLALYRKKYNAAETGFIIRSLIYFEDAESQPDPFSLKQVTWNTVKLKIRTAVKKYVRNIGN